MSKRSKRSASKSVPWTRSIQRDKIPGRTRGGRHAERVDASFAGFLRRLRRLELGVVAMVRLDRKFDLERFCDDVLLLEADAVEKSRGRNVRGSEVQVPHEGGAKRKAARAAKNLRGPESGDEDGEISPFPPGEPDEYPSSSKEILDDE